MRKEKSTASKNGRAGFAALAWASAVWAASTLATSLAPSPSLASEDLVAVTAEGMSQAPNATDAAKEITDKLTAQVAREQAIEIIGDKSYGKNKAAVEAKIVREAPRFIPYVSPSEPARGQDGSWKMQVEFKVSRSSLRALVAQAGLLADAESGPTSALPMMSFVDRVNGGAYRWWDGDPEGSKKYLAQLSRAFHQALRAEMSKQGFFAIEPQSATASMVPDSLRGDRLGPDEIAKLGEYFKAQIVVQGETRIRPSREQAAAFQVSVRLTALQASNGRSVGEVARAFETESGAMEAVVRQRLTAAYPEVCKDLAAQVLEVWQKGALGANLVQLALKGRVGPKQLEAFKAGLAKSVREVKSVRERLFEPSQTVLEVESSATLAQLAERLKSAQIAGFQIRVVETTERAVVIEANAR